MPRPLVPKPLSVVWPHSNYRYLMLVSHMVGFIVLFRLIVSQFVAHVVAHFVAQFLLCGSCGSLWATGIFSGVLIFQVLGPGWDRNRCHHRKQKGKNQDDAFISVLKFRLKQLLLSQTLLFTSPDSFGYERKYDKYSASYNWPILRILASCAMPSQIKYKTACH